MSGTLALPLACFVGLSTQGAEVAATGYARQPTTLMLCEDGVTISNLASIQWPHALASWGVIDTVLIQDMATGGMLLVALPTVTPTLIGQYDIARIPAAGITMFWVKVITRGFGTGRFGTSVFGPFSHFAALPPVAFGMGGFGMFGYASGVPAGVPLQRAFDNQHACEPGTWAPGPFAAAA